jgi:hypothetical protein
MLTHEDSLRLNVLLANAMAVRIDEHAMVVHGLVGTGTARVQLNPDCKPDLYLRRVREALASAVLGSPRGFPVFLQRWARMGQMEGASLDRLLLLGEPEAVMAVACAPSLTEELARRAWWAAPGGELARHMLRRGEVARSPLGAELAAHLAEYLPFETDHVAMLDTVRLLLAQGLVDKALRSRLWQSGGQRLAYRVAFLECCPDELPEPSPARADSGRYRPRLEGVAGGGNALAGLLQRVLTESGQTFVAACDEALRRRPDSHEICVALLDAIGAYFRCGAPAPLAAPAWQAELLAETPELRREVEAVLTLAGSGERLAAPILARTDAVGTLLRRKLEPVVQPLREALAVLRGEGL